jgi:outer membrane protein assembly factor BamB
MQLVGLLTLSLVLLPQSDATRALFEAARKGDLERVRAIVAQGTPANSPHTWGMTPLLIAAQHGQLAVVRFLLENGADANAHQTFHDFSALEAALFDGHVQVAILLLQNGARDREVALEYAVREDALPLAQAAVASGPLLASRLDAIRKRTAGASQEWRGLLAHAEARPDPPPPVLRPAQLAHFARRFESDEGLVVSIAAAEAGLILDWAGTSISLVPVAEQRFRSEDGDVEAIFWGRAGSLEGVRLERGGAPPLRLRETLADIVAPTRVGEQTAAITTTMNWPGFRGENASGIGDGADTPTEWSIETGDNVRWVASLPGLGHSSPVVWGDRVFITTAVADGIEQKVRTGLTGDGGEVEEPVTHSWRVLAFDKQSGRQSWSTEISRGTPATHRHFKATQANSTPATDGHSLAVVFPTAGLAVLDLDGNVRWRQELGGLAAGAFNDPTMQWGFASSPILRRDTVIVQVDIHEGPYIAAWSLEDGKQLWRTEREVAPSWSTPVLFQYGDQEQLVANGSVIRGYDPDTGTELWSVAPNSEQVVATPVVGNGVIFASSGYPPVKPIYALRPGLSGALTLEPGEDHEQLLWSTSRGGAYMPTPLLYRGLFYVVHHNARLVVYEADTGRAISKMRFSQGGTFTASPVAVNGKIYTTTEEGLVYVLEAGSPPRELAVMDMGEPLMASPAVSEGILLLRTPTRLVAVARPEQEASALTDTR